DRRGEVDARAGAQRLERRDEVARRARALARRARLEHGDLVDLDAADAREVDRQDRVELLEQEDVARARAHLAPLPGEVRERGGCRAPVLEDLRRLAARAGDVG